MLSIRTRGKNGIYYIRGSVSLGDKRLDVKEFSSGTSDADAASHLMAEYEVKLRHQLMFGRAANVAKGVMSDAFDSYLSKPKRPHESDILRISILNQHIGDFFDVLPVFSSMLRESFPALLKPAGEELGHEEVKIHGRANRLRAEAG